MNIYTDAILRELKREPYLYKLIKHQRAKDTVIKFLGLNPYIGVVRFKRAADRG